MSRVPPSLPPPMHELDDSSADEDEDLVRVMDWSSSEQENWDSADEDVLSSGSSFLSDEEDEGEDESSEDESSAADFEQDDGEDAHDSESEDVHDGIAHFGDDELCAAVVESPGESPVQAPLSFMGWMPPMLLEGTASARSPPSEASPSAAFGAGSSSQPELSEAAALEVIHSAARRRRRTRNVAPAASESQAAVDAPPAASEPLAVSTEREPADLSSVEAAGAPASPSGRRGHAAIEVNTAVLVRWGRDTYDAVVTGLRKQARGIRVQFDGGHETAWVARNKVKPMPEASSLPPWLRVGGMIDALDARHDRERAGSASADEAWSVASTTPPHTALARRAHRLAHRLMQRRAARTSDLHTA
jgi:hypothetical protein